MKKLLSMLTACLLLLSPFSLTAFADEPVMGQTAAPDWIITEIGNDCHGKAENTNSYDDTVSADCFEFIEIYNNSGKELNLYDYALIYNGNKRSSENFEHQITEYTPIKGGDYLDGSTLVPTEPTLPFGDLSLRPTNPDTCQVAPGEIVVLWMMYLEAYQGRFNDGKGMSVEDFRAHWNIPESVKVIAVDANGNAKNGGHAKNFNVKNSDVGTYGIVRKSDALDAASNVKDAPMVDGNFWESEDLVCWATLDFIDSVFEGSMPNTTYSFTWDFKGYAALDEVYTYLLDQPYVYDARRCFMLTLYDEPSVGTLNPLQKMTVGIELSEGESFTFSSDTTYNPMLEKDILGYKIGGRFYDDGDTFTAPAAGLYTYDFFFEGDEEDQYTVSFEIGGYPFELPADVTVTVGSCIEAPTVELPDDGSRFDGWYVASDCGADSKFDFSTPITGNMTLYAVLIPAETVTEAPTEAPDVPAEVTTVDAPTEAPTDAPKSGCGSVLGLSLLPCTAFVLLLRKKREN